MPLVQSSPPPEPWRVGDRRSPALACLVGALYRYREDLIRIYPNVVLPTDPGNTPTPLAALLLLWANWDYGRGLCPACRSAAVVTSFSGVLSAGSVGGFCTECGMPVARFIGGIGRVRTGCREATAGTPWAIRITATPGGWRLAGDPQVLIAVLQEVGASGLPDTAAVAAALRRS
jgi:hypothetical protein